MKVFVKQKRLICEKQLLNICMVSKSDCQRLGVTMLPLTLINYLIITELLIHSQYCNSASVVDRELLHNVCWCPADLFTELSMSTAVSCWEWIMGARQDLELPVSQPIRTRNRNMQAAPSAGNSQIVWKRGTSVKRGKTCNRRRARVNAGSQFTICLDFTPDWLKK